MADKEATVYVVDLGASMRAKNNDRTQSDLEWSMNYVWEKITSTVATDRKTANVGVVGFRTNDTANEMGEAQGFENIAVLQELSQLLLPDLRALRKKIRLSSTEQGDAISAVVIAIQMIAKHCKRLKWRRKIVLVTDARGPIDAEDAPEIIKKILEDSVELVVVGVDFDDPDYGFKEEDKDPTKRENEKVLRDLVEACNGVFGTMQQAVDELGTPQLKATRPVQSYRGHLTIGKPENYDTALCIDVERFPRTMIRRPLTASQFVQRTDLSGTPSSSAIIPNGQDFSANKVDPSGLTAVKSARAYQVKDEHAPGGKRDVERDDLARGYAYGSTAVHISESEWNVTQLETEAGLEIIGFIPWETYERYMHISASNIIIAQRTNNKAIIALSSFIHALFELESYAVARLVPKNDKAPVILLLAPSIEVDYECLLDVQLPFAEDVRSYKFPPLDRVVTVSGKIITEHRNLPTDALKSAVSEYVDKMDLSELGKDDAGNPAEYMAPADTYSPVLHRIEQAVRFRAVHPAAPIPPPYEILTRYSKPPDELLEKASHHLETLIAAADVKKVPPKVQSRKRNRAEAAPISGLDVEALLGPAPKAPRSVSIKNPIPSFRQMLDTSESSSAIRTAVQQLGAITEQHITESFGDHMYARAIEEMSTMRQEMIEVEAVGVWNEWLRGLKGKLLREELGGDRRDFWWEIKKAGLGLVDVKEEEAKEFMSFT